MTLHAAWLAARIARRRSTIGAPNWPTSPDGSDLVIGRGREAETGVFESRAVAIPAAVLAPAAERARAAGVTIATLVQGASPRSWHA